MGAVAGGSDGQGAGVNATPSRRLAAIMFTDLVGYSAMAHRDEKLAFELLELHRCWIRECLPSHGGIEIETVGDAFLVEFAGALAAVECALAIQQRFAEHNAAAPEVRRMQLRIGIHLGDIEHRDGKVMGDGVNIASRIHGMAEPGGICVSEDVHHAVRNRGFSFEDIGSPALKNIDARVQLFRLAAAPPPGFARVLRRTRRPVAVVASVAVLVAAAVGIWRLGGFQPAQALDKTVAVLPFDNLSSEKDSEYFADGIHDTVITHLAAVKDLNTISRTSVMQYRDPKRNLREIGRALGVAHVVEGTVQRAGNRVRVTAQLIKVADDQHLWAESFDRDIADVFGIQSEIARNVAANVRARLTPTELDTITRRPTASVEAYDLYLRALKIRQQLMGESEKSEREGLALANEAIRKDPGFALAHALAAHFYNSMFWYYDDASAAELAQQAAKKSLALEPDLAEGHIALGQFLYWARRDHAAALVELERARQLAPGNMYVALWTAYVLRRQGKWEEALAQLEQATLLDPANPEAALSYGRSLQAVRRWAEAERVFKRALALDLWPLQSKWSLAFNSFCATGDMSPVAGLVDRASPEERLQYSQAVSFVSISRRDFEAAARAVLEDKREPFFTEGGQVIPNRSFAAYAYMLGGDMKQAALHAREASKILQAQLDEDPGRHLVRVHLAFALVAQGQREKAVAEARRALADSQPVKDAVTHGNFVSAAAQFFAYVREDETALDLLGEALEVPWGTPANFVRHDRFFDGLRDDPRFQKLIAEQLSKDAGA